MEQELETGRKNCLSAFDVGAETLEMGLRGRRYYGWISIPNICSYSSLYVMSLRVNAFQVSIPKKASNTIGCPC